MREEITPCLMLKLKISVYHLTLQKKEERNICF